MWSPYLLYCILEKLQDRAVRIITDSPFDAPARPLLRQLRLPSIAEMIRQEYVSMIYKAINGQAPPHLSSLFNSTSAVTSRMLRNSILNLRPAGMKTRNLGKTALHTRGLRFGTHCLMTVEQLIPFQHLK